MNDGQITSSVAVLYSRGVNLASLATVRLVLTQNLRYNPFIALFLYGLLPIFENTVAGLTQVPTTVMYAARDMGMNGRRACSRSNCH